MGAVVAGFFLGGPLADWAGRRIGMAAGAVLVIIATFMQCFSPRGNIGCFIAGRVVIGIGQGLALTAGPIYIGELSRPEIRGTVMSFWQMFYSVGSFIAYVFRPHRTHPPLTSAVTGSVMQRPNTLKVWVNGTGNWSLFSNSWSLLSSFCKFSLFPRRLDGIFSMATD